MEHASAKTIAAVALAAFAVYLGIYYWPTIERFIGLIASSLAPIVLGFVLAYPLNILMSFFERHLLPGSAHPAVQRLRPLASLIIAVAALAAIVAAVVVLVVPQLIDCIRLLVSEVPVALSALGAWLEEAGILTPETLDAAADSLAAFDWKAGVGDAAQLVMHGVVGAVSGIASGVATFVLAFVFALFVLLGKHKLSGQFNLVLERYLPTRALGRVRYVAGIADDCFHRFLVGQCTEAAILGVLCALGMVLLGLPHPMMIGALTAFMALIPIVGALLSGVIGAFLILMESPLQALVFLVFIIVLQQLEGDLIYPHVVGSSIQLPGIWVLAAVTVGGGAFGIAGMFVGVPLAAVVYRLIRNDVYARRSHAAGEGGAGRP
ncbi:AI-2E family transporter [Collinsella intestinalis]|uniref:AI-2E family transporter n=1 Tax=Collinsella intestinalis TaxID=147207 RepID=UPI001957FB89|nr:AI-2E family transporter [Collinsella intestinalis]MBM6907014.1 AI-2E family transporter [Collinsella intestinalis]